MNEILIDKWYRGIEVYEGANDITIIILWIHFVHSKNVAQIECC